MIKQKVKKRLSYFQRKLSAWFYLSFLLKGGRLDKFSKRVCFSKRKRSIDMNINDVGKLFWTLEYALTRRFCFRGDTGVYKAIIEGLTVSCLRCGVFEDRVVERYIRGEESRNIYEEYFPLSFGQLGIIEKSYYCCSKCKSTQVRTTFDPRKIRRWVRPFFDVYK